MVRNVFLVRDPATHLLVEDGLGLTTVTALLAVVATLPLREDGVLALLVLGDLVGPVLWSAKNLFKGQGGTNVCFLQALPLQSASDR